MSTRSWIARKTENGFECIWCHWDGYPSHHGPILVEAYATDAKVAQLMNLGDLEVLGRELGEAHDYDKHDKNPAADHWCLAYGRDRKEKGMKKHIFGTEKELCDHADNTNAAYVYLFREGGWIYRETSPNAKWQKLTVQKTAIRIFPYHAAVRAAFLTAENIPIIFSGFS